MALCMSTWMSRNWREGGKHASIEFCLRKRKEGTKKSSRGRKESEEGRESRRSLSVRKGLVLTVQWLVALELEVSDNKLMVFVVERIGLLTQSTDTYLHTYIHM